MPNIHKLPNEKQRLPIVVMLTFGGISGIIAQTVVYPLDVVRRRMQAPNYSSGFSLNYKNDCKRDYKSTWDGLRQIVRKGGFVSLFSGLSINYMKVIPATAVGFTVYDYLKSKLELKSNL